MPMIIRLCITILFIAFHGSLYAQNDGRKLYDFFGETDDPLFYNGVKYMCSKSPLSFFDNYDTVFCAKITCLSNYTTIPIVNDKDFQACWFIKDSMLYLFDICFSCDTLKNDDPQRFDTIQNFTGKKMMKPDFTIPSYLKNERTKQGVMNADWYSDTLYIKQKPDHLNAASALDKTPLIRLIFKKGKVVQSDHVSGMPRKYSVEKFKPYRSNNNPVAKTKKRTYQKGFYGKTNDILFFSYGGEMMCSISPLSSFKGYTTLYSSSGDCEREIILPIEDDKNYEAIWIVHKEQLYLYDVHFYCEKAQYLNEDLSRFDAIERLTGLKMTQVTIDDLPEYLEISPKGLLPATWFSGIMYVKLTLLPHEGYYGSRFEKRPFLRLEFKDGKIVDRQEVHEMPEL